VLGVVGFAIHSQPQKLSLNQKFEVNLGGGSHQDQTKKSKLKSKFLNLQNLQSKGFC
jgi:hypothetical protein